MTVVTRTWRTAALAVLTLLTLGDSRYARVDAQQPADVQRGQRAALDLAVDRVPRNLRESSRVSRRE